MTGYGRGEVKKNGKEITVEIRSLNNRFLDVSIRLPKSLSVYEEEVRNLVRKYLTRGRINVIVNVKEMLNEKNLNNKVNLELAQSYLNQLEAIRKKLHLTGKIKLEHLLAFSDIFISEFEEEMTDQTWKDVQKSIIEALDNLKNMRLSEGNELSVDLTKRINTLEHNICQIEK